MFATVEDLESTLRLSFTPDQQTAAALLLQGIEGRVRMLAGSARADNVAEDQLSAEFQAVRDVVLSLAARRFGNPEGWLQKRMGADYSTSYADSVAAAVSLTADEKADVRAAFGMASVASVPIGRLPAYDPATWVVNE